MLLLHEHNLLFLKPRKVAGTSLEIAMSKFAGPRDIVTPVGTGKQAREDDALRRELGFRQPQNYRYSISEVSLAKKWETAKANFKNDIRTHKIKFYNHIPSKLARERLGESR